jgi:hypothetical protein
MKGLKGEGLRVQDNGFRDQGSLARVQGEGFRIPRLRFKGLKGLKICRFNGLKV